MFDNPIKRRQKADQHQGISPINEEIEEEMVLLEEDPGEDHLLVQCAHLEKYVRVRQWEG
jgi:hypothetical protein